MRFTGSMESDKAPACQIMRKDRSPMNPKVWVYQLACGHDFFAANGLLRRPIPCHKCLEKQRSDLGAEK